MSDRVQITVLKTPGFEEDSADEIWRIALDGADGGVEELYRATTLELMAREGIYAWRVHDHRVLTSIGASAEVRDILIFLTGAAAGQFTGEVVKRLTAALEAIARRLWGDNEISDQTAFNLAVLRHREACEYAKLLGMARNERGNRTFLFADGTSIELDARGAVVKVTDSKNVSGE
jgi:hypothetical protein